MSVRVVAVGTVWGSDAAGLAVAERLRAAPLPPGVSVVTCERPGLDLLDELAAADAVVLVDAMRSGRAPGTLARIRREELRSAAGVSNHGLGVAETLRLGEALERLPARLEILGIEGDDAGEAGLSPAVLRGVDRAAAFVLERVRELAARDAATCEPAQPPEAGSSASGPGGVASPSSSR